MKNLSLGVKLGIGFAVILCISCLLGGMAIWKMKEQDQGSTLISEVFVPEVNFAVQYERATRVLREAVLNFTNTGDEQYYRKSQEQMDEMEENVYLAEFHAGKGHLEQLAELDNRFHMQLYEACESKMLIHLLKDFHQYVQKERQQTLSDKERSKEAVAEHKKIMEAIRDGDARLAEELADEHICNAFRNMVKCGLSTKSKSYFVLDK